MSARYFPQFWRQTRPYAKSLAPSMHAAAQSGGVPAANEILFSSIARAASSAGRLPRDMLQGAWFTSEAMAAQTLAQWEVEGSRVVDYAPELVEALRWSEPGDLRLSDVLPFLTTATYHHFGPQADWLLDGVNPVEGVITLAPASGYLRTLLVARAGGAWQLGDGGSFQMLRFRLSDMGDMPFADAVDAAVRLDIEDIDTALEKLGSEGQSAGLTLRERQQMNAGLYVQALRLLGCSLAYLQAYADDVVSGWQPDTPIKWIHKTQVPGKEGPRSASKLRAMGYVEVLRVGDAFAAAERAHGDQHGPPSPHWRRGHWRHQAHGPNFSLRKLIWIRPMRVLGG